METIKDILSVLGNVVNGLSGMIMGLGFGFLSAPTALGYCAGIIGMLVFKTVIPINIQGETIVLAGSVGKNFRERISIVFYSGIIMVVLGALDVFPGYRCDTEIYEKAGLMDNGPVVGAHFIFPSQTDIDIIKRHNGFVVHCPDATTNIIAGIMGVAALQDDGVNISLGSDVGGGHSMGVYTQIARSVQLSKLKWFYEPETNRPITFTNAFYLATKAGGSVFGKLIG